MGSPEIHVRILLSAALGFLIGLDRTSKNKPAGIKTFMYQDFHVCKCSVHTDYCGFHRKYPSI